VAKKREQIEDALKVLDSVHSLLELDMKAHDRSDRSNILNRYRYETFFLAWQNVRDVRDALARAQLASHETADVTELEEKLFEFVRPFRAIGPRKLADLVRARSSFQET